MNCINPHLFFQYSLQGTTGSNIEISSPGSQTLPRWESEPQTKQRPRPFVIYFPGHTSYSQIKLPILNIEKIQLSLPAPWLHECEQRLQEISKLPSGWDSYNAAAPNNHALLYAKEILAKLYAASLPPTRIAPSVEEGVAISFSKGDLYAVIECYNDGGVVVGLSSKNSEPKVWEVMSESDTDEAIERIGTYLNG